MLNIVIPMAGRGSRFAEAGFEKPKPLIDIHGLPMIEYVVKNITPRCEHRFIFICQQEHLKSYDLEGILHRLSSGCIVIPITYVTEGAACTVLLSEKYINNEDSLMIANCDQYIDICIDKYLSAMGTYDGLIMTMPASHPKWSYIKYEGEEVNYVREKEVISDQATVGIYNYKHGYNFVKYAHQMIDRNIRVNNEFYVAPVYNEMIEAGQRITYYDIGDRMFGLGTPEDLSDFKNNSVSVEFNKGV